MDSGVSLEADRPLSVEEIVEMAEKYDFNGTFPFDWWCRAAGVLYMVGISSAETGDYPRAYLLLYRYSMLVLQHMPQHEHHPRNLDPVRNRELFFKNRAHVQSLLARQKQILTELENIKPHITQQYNDWVRTSKAEADVFTSGANAPNPNAAAARRILDPSQNKELVVDLAQQVIRRRETQRLPRAGRDAKIARREDAGRTGGGEHVRDLARGGDEDFQRTMESARRQLDRRPIGGGRPAENRSDSNVAMGATVGRYSGYSYPKISPSHAFFPEGQAQTQTQMQPPALTSATSSYFQPPHPPKEYIAPPPLPPLPPPLQQQQQQQQFPPPAIPRKDPLPVFSALAPTPSPTSHSFDPPTAPIRPPKEYFLDTLPDYPGPEAAMPAAPVVAGSVPAVPAAPAAPAAAPDRVFFQSSALEENGSPLRSVFVPATLRACFLELATEHTCRGVEMCGILAGVLVNNALFITTLVIPEQKCTADTCDTVNEGTLFDYCIEHDVIVLGWIHTHPTQSCFMSSRDLHTHSGYQIMLAESIAIVCAPQYEPSYGIFRLTNPPGLDHILTCTKKEAFHMHNEKRLYAESQFPEGHVYESASLSLTMHDLRETPGY